MRFSFRAQTMCATRKMCIEQFATVLRLQVEVSPRDEFKPARLSMRKIFRRWPRVAANSSIANA